MQPLLKIRGFVWSCQSSLEVFLVVIICQVKNAFYLSYILVSVSQ